MGYAPVGAEDAVDGGKKMLSSSCRLHAGVEEEGEEEEDVRRECSHGLGKVCCRNVFFSK